jgi:hypothetical protein
MKGRLLPQARRRAFRSTLGPFCKNISSSSKGADSLFDSLRVHNVVTTTVSFVRRSPQTRGAELIYASAKTSN